MALARDKLVNLLTIYRRLLLSNAQSELKLTASMALQFFLSRNSRTERQTAKPNRTIKYEKNKKLSQAGECNVNAHAPGQTNTR